MKMRKWALLCAALLLLTACSAAPKFDLAAGEIAVAEDLVLGMPMEDVPQAWQQGTAACTYAGIDFTGGLEAPTLLLPLHGTRSEDAQLTFLCCAADEALTARQVEDLRRALERDHGLELQLLADNPGDTRWYRLAHPGCVRLFHMGEDPDAQSAYLVFLLASD